jgi:hypothetical protein
MSSNQKGAYAVIPVEEGKFPVEQRGKKTKMAWMCLILLLMFLITFNLPDMEIIIQKTESKPLSFEDDAIDPAKEPTCLTFDDAVARRVTEADQVFITMPAKASGTTLKHFAQQCTKTIRQPDNFINKEDARKDFMSSTMNLPKIIASHVHPALGSLTRLAQTTPNDVLTIFIYREESERKVSAIKHVVESRLCTKEMGQPDFKAEDYVHITKNETACVIESETEFMHNVVEKGLFEIGYDTNVILSCDLYDAIDDNNPNMLMINYKQVDQLQEVLAKRHCPELLDELPLHANVANQKREWAYIRTHENGAEVPLAEWAKSKQHLWNWAFDATKVGDKTCRSRTRHLEKELFSCGDQVTDMSPEWAI